jgi:hypothetical protein
MTKEDTHLIINLMGYLSGSKVLSPKERKRWEEVGVITNNDVNVSPIYFGSYGMIMPAYWIKCLLAYNNILEFDLSPYTNEPKVEKK